MPPDSLCGYSSKRCSGVGMRTRRSISIARASRLARASSLVAHDRLDDLLADRVGRIERGHRLLEDHREPVAAQVAQRALAARQADRGPRTSTSPRHVRARRRQQAHDRRATSRSCRSPIRRRCRACGRARRRSSTPSTARAAPSSVAKRRRRSLDFEQRFGHAARSLPRLGGKRLAMPASITARSMIAGRILRASAGSCEKCDPALAARPPRGARARRAARRGRRRAGRGRNIPRRRRSASAADCLPRLSPPASSPAFSAAMQPARRRAARRSPRRPRTVSRDRPAARPACCRRPRSPRRMQWPHQSTQSSPVWAANRPSRPSHGAGAARGRRRAAVRMRTTSRPRDAARSSCEAARAVERIEQRLRGDRARRRPRCTAHARRRRRTSRSRPRCRSRSGVASHRPRHPSTRSLVARDLPAA